jgi:hypothetical protein
MSFWFYEGEPKRFNLVYALAGIGLDAHMDRIALTLESQKGIEWRWVLDEGSTGEDDLGAQMRPVDPQDGPLGPTILPTTPPPSGDDEEELPGAAGVG